MKKKILFQIISGQLLPLFLANDIIKPDINIYLYTAESVSNLHIIKEVIKTESEEVLISSNEFISIKKTVYSNLLKYIKGLGSYANKNVIKIQDDDRYDVFLNITTGTKIMSLACFELFISLNYACLYIDTENKNILYIKNQLAENKPIESKVKIEELLKLNGYVIKLKIIDIEYEMKALKFSKAIRQHYKKLSPLLLKLSKENIHKDFTNKYQMVNSTNIGQTKFYKKKDEYIFEMNIQYENSTISDIFTTPNKEIIQFLKGGWFEIYLCEYLKKLKIFDYVQSNIEIESNNKNNDTILNEFDILGIKGIIPYLFEIKSGGINILYIDKLIALKQRYLPLYSKLIFISYFPLNNQIPKSLKQKIETHRIGLYNIDNLKNIVEDISNDTFDNI